MSAEIEQSIMKSIRDFIKKCPYLPDFKRSIGVDYLAPDVQSYMVESVPCDTIVKRYINGSSIRQFRFNFSSRETYSIDVLNNLSNSMFYENFQNWLEDCSRAKDLPNLADGKVAHQIMATTSGYVFDTEQEKAQYMIQCNMIYYNPR